MVEKVIGVLVACSLSLVAPPSAIEAEGAPELYDNLSKPTAQTLEVAIHPLGAYGLQRDNYIFILDPDHILNVTYTGEHSGVAPISESITVTANQYEQLLSLMETALASEAPDPYEFDDIWEITIVCNNSNFSTIMGSEAKAYEDLGNMLIALSPIEVEMEDFA